MCSMFVYVQQQREQIRAAVVSLMLSPTAAQFDVPRIFGVVYAEGIFCLVSSKAVLVTVWPLH